MRFITQLVLRQRARQCVLNALRFAERLRKQNSEFAPSYSDTISNIGDELSMLARELCRNDAERRALLAGLMSAFQKMYQNNPALAARIVRRLSPRIMNSGLDPANSQAWMDSVA